MGTMGIDTLVVLLIVAGAALFIGRRAWRTLQQAREKGAACNSCGCGDAKEPLSL